MPGIMSRVFGGGSKGGTTDTRKRREKKVGGEQLQAKDGLENDALLSRDADRQIYRFEMPEQTRGFSDLLDMHDVGERFPSVAIVGDPGETTSARNRRLIQTAPHIKRAMILLPKRISVSMVNQQEQLPLSSLLAKKTKYPYVHFQRITIIITPLSSIFDEFTDVKATILDKRFRRANEKNTLILSSNENYVGDMSLDYSVPVSSLDKILLCINLEVPIMNDGEQWASCQMEVIVEESDYPLTIPFKEVLAVAKMPPTALEKFHYDPTRRDMTIHNNHRPTLMEMFRRGEIANELDPIEEKTGKLEYTKSTVGPGYSKKRKEGMVPVEGWEEIKKNTSKIIKQDQMSLDFDDVGEEEEEERSQGASEDSVDVKLRQAREHAEEMEKKEVVTGNFSRKDDEEAPRVPEVLNNPPKLSKLARARVGFSS